MERFPGRPGPHPSRGTVAKAERRAGQAARQHPTLPHLRKRLERAPGAGARGKGQEGQMRDG